MADDPADPAVPAVGPVTDRLRRGWRPQTMAEALDFLHTDLFQAPAGLFRDGDGLARSAALLAALGDPQDRIPVVHVAGTAGKGTVASGLAAVATDEGLSVGLHVSPHVYDLRERFAVDGRWSSPDEVVDLLGEVLPAAADLAATDHGPPTFFEVTLAMALLHFVRQGCDLVVLETGLGGRYDSTNTVTRPDKLAVITRISFDHEAVLGSTLEAIAAQKAGILPLGGEAVVLHHGVAAVDDTLAEEARRRRCRLHPVTAPRPGPGQVAHVVEDAALVSAATALLDVRRGRRPDPDRVEAVLAGLALPGRFERVRTPSGAEVVLDGAHNPVKLAALIDRLSVSAGGEAGHRWRWVFGCRRDKKASEMLAQLAAVAAPGRSIALVQFPITAGDVPADVSTTTAELAAGARARGIAGAFEATLAEAADFAAGEGPDPVVVAGSFHLLAALRPLLGVAPWSPPPARGVAGVSEAGPSPDA